MLKMHTTGFTYTSPTPTRNHVISHQFNSKPSAVSLYVGSELVISEVNCDENTVTVTTREDVILEVICTFPVDISHVLTFGEFIKSDLIKYTAAVQQTIDMGIDIGDQITMIQQQEYKSYVDRMVEDRRVFYVETNNLTAVNKQEFISTLNGEI